MLFICFLCFYIAHCVAAIFKIVQQILKHFLINYWYNNFTHALLMNVNLNAMWFSNFPLNINKLRSEHVAQLSFIIKLDNGKFFVSFRIFFSIESDTMQDQNSSELWKKWWANSLIILYGYLSISKYCQNSINLCNQ